VYDAAKLLIVPNQRNSFDLLLQSQFVPNEKIEDIADPKLIFSSFRESASVNLAGLRNMNEPAEILDAMEELYRTGYQALSDLLQVNTVLGRPRIKKVRDFFKDLLARAPQHTTMLVNVVTPFPLPLDCMPLIREGGLRVDPGSNFENRQDLAHLAQRVFLGMRMVIRQVTPNEEVTEQTPLVSSNKWLAAQEFDGQPRLSVAPYWNPKIAQVKIELSELGRLTQTAPIVIQDVLPDKALMQRRDTRDEIARLLVEGRNVDRVDSIVYVTAHGVTEGPGSDHGLLFGKKWLSSRDVLVRVKDIGAAADNAVTLESDGPLTILSACGVADVSYTDPTTIPNILRACGHRAVIAPLVALHVEGARVFSIALMQAIVENHPLGEALLIARQKVLEGFGNVVGLLFACFGDSLLQIDPACL
jgi:hypothetical protein